MRDAAAVRYAELLSKILGVIAPFEPETSRAIHHLYVIHTKERDAPAEHVKSQGVFSGLHYHVPVRLQKGDREWGDATGSFPVTERVASEILSLPMSPGLTAEQQQRVAESIATGVQVPARP